MRIKKYGISIRYGVFDTYEAFKKTYQFQHPFKGMPEKKREAALKDFWKDLRPTKKKAEKEQE